MAPNGSYLRQSSFMPLAGDLKELFTRSWSSVSSSVSAALPPCRNKLRKRRPTTPSCLRPTRSVPNPVQVKLKQEVTVTEKAVQRSALSTTASITDSTPATDVLPPSRSGTLRLRLEGAHRVLRPHLSAEWGRNSGRDGYVQIQGTYEQRVDNQI